MSNSKAGRVRKSGFFSKHRDNRTNISRNNNSNSSSNSVMVSSNNSNLSSNSSSNTADNHNNSNSSSTSSCNSVGNHNDNNSSSGSTLMNIDDGAIQMDATGTVVSIDLIGNKQNGLSKGHLGPFDIVFQHDTGYVNISKFLTDYVNERDATGKRVHKKKWSWWRKNKGNIAFMESIARQLNKDHYSELIIENSTHVCNEGRGTFVHIFIAYAVAMWADTEYFVTVMRILTEIQFEEDLRQMRQKLNLFDRKLKQAKNVMQKAAQLISKTRQETASNDVNNKLKKAQDLLFSNVSSLTDVVVKSAAKTKKAAKNIQKTTASICRSRVLMKQGYRQLRS